MPGLTIGTLRGTSPPTRDRGGARAAGDGGAECTVAHTSTGALHSRFRTDQTGTHFHCYIIMNLPISSRGRNQFLR